MSENISQRNSKTNCCVVACHNGYYNTGADIKFYNFPNKWYEKERKQIWINSIRRKRSEDTKQPWQPKLHDKICSIHFVGNEKSNDCRSPAYHPTIFPQNYLKSSGAATASKTDRFKRLQNRSATKEKKHSSVESEVGTFFQDQEVTDSGDEEHIVDVEVEELKKDFCCQTSAIDFESGDDLFIFESNFASGSCEVATQCHIPTDHVNLFSKQKDECVGNDDIIECKGFHGVKSLKTDRELNCLAGVFFDRFTFLLSLLTTVHKNSKLTTENRLLLFLLKMKLGLSFSALGVFFQLHHTTCNRIFVSVLEELVQKTKNIIFWPSRDIIDQTMPKAFKVNYPKCRAIIDCTEIKIQQPKKVDQRVYTYSQYKSAFTAKFLISISPTGFISFLSKCYGGRTSDSFLTNDCGFLGLLEPNDVVLADKGFPGIKCKDDVILVLPPFVHEGHLSYEEVEETFTIASVRIHVERTIQRFKTHNILQKIPYNLFPYLDDIVYMCGVLTNLQPPIIADDDED